MNGPESHPQLAEIVARLRADRACAVVHVETSREIGIEFDSESGTDWYVSAGPSPHGPTPEAQLRLEAQGFEVDSNDIQPRFGPARGTTFTVYSTSIITKSADDAGHAAITLVAELWQVPTTEWLWITAYQHDSREEAGPQRPAVWPPA